MSEGLIWYWGNYEHPAGEVYPKSIEVVPAFTEDGVRWASRVRYEVGGTFCIDPQSEFDPPQVNAKIAEFNSAYGVDDQDFGFKLADGTPTAHKIETNNELNLSGNKVYSRSWDYIDPNEFANTRSFTVVVGALMLESYSTLLAFKEEVIQIGNGGPNFTYRAKWQGVPTLDIVSERTPVKLIQRGHYETLTPNVGPPAPWWPDYEQGQYRVWHSRGGRHHGHPSFNKATHYRYEYSYTFLMPLPPSHPTLGYYVPWQLNIWNQLPTFPGFQQP
jgi:hypothetical protein